MFQTTNQLYHRLSDILSDWISIGVAGTHLEGRPWQHPKPAIFRVFSGYVPDIQLFLSWIFRPIFSNAFWLSLSLSLDVLQI